MAFKGTVCALLAHTHWMVMLEDGVVVRPVVRNDHAPPSSLAAVLIRRVEEVAVEEDGIAGIELAKNAIEPPLRPIHPRGIGSALWSVACCWDHPPASLTALLEPSRALNP